MFRFKEVFIILALLVETILSANLQYEACKPKYCGDNLSISYPFWIHGQHESYCGLPLFQINCTEEKPTIRVSNYDYIVHNISYGNLTIQLVDVEALDATCPTLQHNISLHDAPFQRGPNYIDLYFFYNCTSVPSESFTYPVGCATNSSRGQHSFAVFSHQLGLQYLNASSRNCESMVNAPVDIDEGTNYETLAKMSYLDVLREGFHLKWPITNNCSACEKSGGHCGFEHSNFVCFCPDQPYSRICRKGKPFQYTVLSVYSQFVFNGISHRYH
ncbi:non-specific serine/threonine protein kinase [Ranunculus cassubicifolius]